jgi:hypothetical protein
MSGYGVKLRNNADLVGSAPTQFFKFNIGLTTQAQT